MKNSNLKKLTFIYGIKIIEFYNEGGVCVCVLHAPGCSKQTRSFSKNTREGGYPSNQDTRERKQKKYEKQGGNMSMSKVDGREKESKGKKRKKSR